MVFINTDLAVCFLSSKKSTLNERVKLSWINYLKRTRL